MPYSMTAFARVEFSEPWGRGSWELRSVNHRHIDIGVRLPDDFRQIEGAVRERIGAAARRGKVECTLRFVGGQTGFETLQVNDSAALAVIAAAERIAALGGGGGVLNPFDVLRWPGVTAVAEPDLDEARSRILDHLDDALDAFLDARRREGEKLSALIAQRLDGIRAQVEMLTERVPEIIAAIRERHAQRLRDVVESLDPARVEQECALLIQRLDVAEELDRLATHVEEVARVLEQDEPLGRRLDFLLQELNREANTLGSKSAHVDTAGAAIELKVLIEQIREQVQNLE